MHKNLIVRNSIKKNLTNKSGIILTEPLKYNELIATMKSCHFIITDSGGIQEEAPALGKPVLVLRNKTEREEAIKAGTAKLVGTEKNIIISESIKLLTNQDYYLKMSNIKNPFGPTISIKTEHMKGPLIAPSPNANCNPAPAATNFSFGI